MQAKGSSLLFGVLNKGVGDKSQVLRSVLLYCSSVAAVQQDNVERYQRQDGYKFQFRHLRNFEAIQRQLDQQGQRLSGEDRAAALTRIRQIVEQQGVRPPYKLLDTIQELIQDRIEGEPLSPKALAQILHGMVKLDIYQHSDLFDLVLSKIKERSVLAQLDVVRLLNVLQVAKDLNIQDSQLLSNIAAELRYTHINNLDAQGIAQVFTAFNKLKCEFGMLMAALEQEIIKRKLGPELQLFNIGQIILACGHFQRYDEVFIQYLIAEVKQRNIVKCNPVIITNVLYGLVLLRHRDEEIVGLIADRLDNDWNITSLNSISWSAFCFQMMDYRHQHLINRFTQVLQENFEMIRKPSTVCRLLQAVAYWDKLSIDDYFKIINHLQDLHAGNFEFQESDWYSLYQTYLLVGLNVKLDVPLPDHTAPFLQKVVENARQWQQIQDSQSIMSLKVSLGLHEMKIQHEPKKILPQCNYTATASCIVPSCDDAVLIVVGSPSMHFRNFQDVPTGQLQTIIKSLQTSGFKVVVLLESELQLMEAADQIQHYIQAKMKQCGLFD
eukprot:TRINITY_DN6974_c0_g1_i2.p1 TRINITY_DN6974_c0_g1~~TRINITY_DN6974_c0_g1_i2.p1  ORF type:complete len:552 (-),score=45.00 TRINITY_DN6974_c0_g1_i2:303-1958(-)